jgi:hypothetical protein
VAYAAAHASLAANRDESVMVYSRSLHGCAGRLPRMTNEIRTLLASWKESPLARFEAADHRGWTYDKLALQMGSAAGYTVLSGPYRGMKYFAHGEVPIIDRSPTTKFLGSFEQELHPWIDSLIDRRFEKIIHLGSGEGYHVVGLARRIPSAHTIVFDTLIASRKACRVLADQNNVRSRIQLRGFCGSDGLMDMDLSDSLVFSDCGGAELLLLDPIFYPSLSRATILVETHDAFDPRITPRLMARFSGTHSVQQVTATDRDPREYQLLRSLRTPVANMALMETRELTKTGKPQAWALFSPYSS